MQQQKAGTDAQPPSQQTNVAHDAIETEGERQAKICYQCGACTGGCPIARRSSDFNPRKIVQRFLLKREDKIPSASVWLCLLCHTCVERCPQEVKPSHVIVALRNKAVRCGDLKDYIKEEFARIFETGWSIQVMPAIVRRRESLGLPPAPNANVEEVQSIIRIMGLQKLLGDAKESDVEE